VRPPGVETWSVPPAPVSDASRLIFATFCWIGVSTAASAAGVAPNARSCTVIWRLRGRFWTSGSPSVSAELASVVSRSATG
jgi:hypothetical protein